MVKMKWHSATCNLLDAFADTINTYFVSELASCGTLRDYICDAAPLRREECQFYLGNMVMAIEYIHSLQMVHGDIKGNNFFMAANGYLMLGDFGSSLKEYIECDSWGGMMGTTAYSPPEFLRNNVESKYRRHIDWWGVACLCYEMHTGYLVRTRNITGSTDVSDCMTAGFSLPAQGRAWRQQGADKKGPGGLRQKIVRLDLCLAKRYSNRRAAQGSRRSYAQTASRGSVWHDDGAAIYDRRAPSIKSPLGRRST